MTDKYRLRSDLKHTHNGQQLSRLEALKDFNDVKAGDLGGFVESADNLSQDGNCWLYDKSMAVGNSRVTGSARLLGNAIASGSTEVSSGDHYSLN